MSTATRQPTPSAEAGCSLLIFRLARATGFRLGEALASVEMRTHAFAVLQHLQQAGPLSQQDLGAALRINPSNLVGLLDALESEGLIVRTRDPADRRRHLVEPTSRGRRRLAAAKRAVEEAERHLLAPLDSAERAQFKTLLERLAGHSCAGRGRGRC